MTGKPWQNLRVLQWLAELHFLFACSPEPVIRKIQDAGCSTLREIAEALNRRGIQTARGAEWTAMAVKRVIDRAA
jgi:hypothetical protein